MREGLKEDRYNLRMQQVEPLVPRYLRMGIPERVRSNGATATPINDAAIDQALEYFQNEGIEAIAVCFLFSYMNPEHEQRVGQKIRALFPNMYTSLSHHVLPQIKEFDRLSTTVVNSYVGPVLSEYLQRLKENLARFQPPPEHIDNAIERRCRVHRRLDPSSRAVNPLRPRRWSQRSILLRRNYWVSQM